MNQLSPVRVVCATSKASFVFYVDRHLQSCAGIGSLKRRCKRSSLAGSGLCYKVNAGHKIASAKARVNCSFHLSRIAFRQMYVRWSAKR